MSDDTVYAVASGKGGVGKTTMTANVAVAVADLGYDVAIVDCDLGMANLAGWFAIVPSGPTLTDVLAGRASVTDAMYDAPGGVTLVPGSNDVQEYTETDADELDAVVETLRDRYEYVFLDIGAGISHETVLPLGLADGVVLVTTPDEAALENAQTTIDVIERLDGAVTGLIVNKARSDSTIPSEFAETHTILGTVPEDRAVHASHTAGMPHLLDQSDSAASDAFRQAARRLTGDEEPTGSQSIRLDELDLGNLNAVDVEDGQLLIDLAELDTDELDFNPQQTTSDRPTGDTVLDLDAQSAADDHATTTDDTSSSSDQSDEGDQSSTDEEDRGGFFSRLLP